MLIQEFDHASSVFCCRVRFDDVRLDAAHGHHSSIVGRLVVDDPAQVEGLLKDTYSFPITLDIVVTGFATNLEEFVRMVTSGSVALEGAELRCVGLGGVITSSVVEIKPDFTNVVHHDLGEGAVG
jgi:hypothetical protein